MTIGSLVAATASVMLSLSACESPPDKGGVPAAQVDASEVKQYVAEIVRRIPHDPTAFTQGLVLRGGLLYESTGRYGESSIRRVDPSTGAVLERVDLPRNVFGEGLAFTGSDLVQLSWNEFLAYFYDPDSLQLRKTIYYAGEGWGLCYDGEHLLMTTGGDQLVTRDPRTFEALSAIQITRAGVPLFFVNELECVGEAIWGNVYPTSRIVQIDKATGRVLAELDGANLIPAGVDPDDTDQALNGIAYDPAAGTFYVTGKLWPAMFEVKFVPKPEG